MDAYGLIEIGAGIVTLYLVLNFLRRIYEAKQKTLAKVSTPTNKKESIASKLPESGYDLLKQAEVGLEKFGDDMAKALHEKGIADPMTDAGYAHLVARLIQIRKWRTSYESNPLLQIADSIGWPILKRLPDSALQWIEAAV